MEIKRADVTKIDVKHRARLLKELRVSSTDLLAVGTEAEVYSLGEAHVLKLYGDSRRLSNLQVLRGFYDLLDEGPSGLKFPRIVEIRQCGSLIGVVESRVSGRPLERMLGALDATSEAKAIDFYLKAVRSLREVKITSAPAKYMLFDESDRSSVSRQTWSEFYERLLSEKVERTGDLLPRNVSAFRPKFERLLETVRTDVDVKISMVHGDFCPGNLLVSEDLSKAIGVVDFGSFTLFGDSMLDMAGAVGFYRMYDPERKAIRNNLLDRTEEVLTSRDIGRMYRYLAAHAIITCDLYISEPNPRENGHFQWAVEILEDSRVWSNLR